MTFFLLALRCCKQEGQLMCCRSTQAEGDRHSHRHNIPPCAELQRDGQVQPKGVGALFRCSLLPSDLTNPTFCQEHT